MRGRGEREAGENNASNNSWARVDRFDRILISMVPVLGMVFEDWDSDSLVFEEFNSFRKVISETERQLWIDRNSRSERQ